MKQFNYKKCIKEIKNNKVKISKDEYWLGWDEAHDTIIDIINSNMEKAND
jgi:hypothetical protein